MVGFPWHRPERVGNGRRWTNKHRRYGPKLTKLSASGPEDAGPVGRAVVLQHRTQTKYVLHLKLLVTRPETMTRLWRARENDFPLSRFLFQVFVRDDVDQGLGWWSG